MAYVGVTQVGLYTVSIIGVGQGVSVNGRAMCVAAVDPGAILCTEIGCDGRDGMAVGRVAPTGQIVV